MRGFWPVIFHNSSLETKEHSEKRGMRSVSTGVEPWFQNMRWHWGSGIGAALDLHFVACFRMSSLLHLALWSNSVEPEWEINRKV